MWRTKEWKWKRYYFFFKLTSASDEFPIIYLFIYLFPSGHCFCQGVVSTVRSASPLTKSPHMVALVSFPPNAGSQRGLTVATDLSKDKSPLVTVTG